MDNVLSAGCKSPQENSAIAKEELPMKAIEATGDSFCIVCSRWWSPENDYSDRPGSGEVWCNQQAVVLSVVVEAFFQVPPASKEAAQVMGGFYQNV
jgi:hypothetical protein